MPYRFRTSVRPFLAALWLALAGLAGVQADEGVTAVPGSQPAQEAVQEPPAHAAASLPQEAKPGRGNLFSRLSTFLSLGNRSESLPAEPVALDEPLVVHEIRREGLMPRGIDLTTPPDTMWDRIRHGFSMPALNDDLVLYYQQWYMSRPEALRRMAERARPYLFHIVEEIEARGMPTELAFLPMVESAFNPQAYSRAHASGLWQFIPATGKRFNLEQNWWQDQRRDVLASTSAALEYLQTIYNLNGDWHLALASYNWGEGAVKRAVEKNAARGLPTDFVNLSMPTETRHYVPKLQALKNIFGNPRLVASLNLPDIPNQPYFSTVGLGQPVDIKTAARLANMPLQEFLALNPSHNRPVINPDAQLVIPNNRIAQFQANLQNTSEPLSRWQAYTLKPGERLDKLAPRFGIKLSDLLRLNGLSGRIKLGTGVTLLVPNGTGGTEISDLPLPPVTVPEPVRKVESQSHAAVKPHDKAGSGKSAAHAAPPSGHKGRAAPAKPAVQAAPRAKATASAKPADKAKAASHPAKKGK